MEKVELLAPAGSILSLYAAVQNGADAVYLGGNKFSARAFAENFNEEHMVMASDYCHIYGVKLYVTLNTLVKENEIQELIEYVGFLYRIGIDALIVQDMGVYNLIKHCHPDMAVHASTQMTVHNGEGALLLKEMGFQRIVLSRELNLKEIEHISRDLKVETEVFIHGALCVSYSGMCLMSSLIGGRSGNRGKCAQPCRLPYTLVNKNNDDNFSGYLLSPKDICTIDILEDILKTGVKSLKIEGRMKRPEYVAGVVQMYRRALDAIYSGVSFDLEESYNILMKLFNREGFSKGYLKGYTGRDMMAFNNPKNSGITIGTVQGDLSLKLLENVSLKDGLSYGEDGFSVSKVIKNSKEVIKAYKGDIVKIFPAKYLPGAMLNKTSDFELMKSLQESYELPFKLKLHLKLKVSFIAGKPISATVVYLGKQLECIGDIAEIPIGKPLTQDRISQALKKDGDTPYSFSDIEFEEFGEGYISIASINKLRRDIVAQLIQTANEGYRKDIEETTCLYYNNSKNTTKEVNTVLITVNNMEAYEAVKSFGYDAVIDYLGDKKSDIKLEDICGKEDIYLKLPNIIKEEFEEVVGKIDEFLPKLKGIITGNLGIIRRYKGRVPLIGDYKLNIFNSAGAYYYKDFLDMECLSVELNKREIKELLTNINMPVAMLIYGRIELMVSEYCPAEAVFCSVSNKKCNNNCQKGSYVLEDRKNEEFLLVSDKYCRSHVYNGKSLNLISNLKEIKAMGINNFRLDFIDESREEIIEILNKFKEEAREIDMTKYTRGHFKRGVE